MTERGVTKGNDYIEFHGGGYRVVGTRISLDSVVYAFRNGESPEGIVESFPSLTPARVYGAIAFYLEHRNEIDAYLWEGEKESEARREAQRKADPEFFSKLSEAKRRGDKMIRIGPATTALIAAVSAGAAAAFVLHYFKATSGSQAAGPLFVLFLVVSLRFFLFAFDRTGLLLDSDLTHVRLGSLPAVVSIGLLVVWIGLSVAAVLPAPQEYLSSIILISIGGFIVLMNIIENRLAKR